ncbi:MAG: CPBP family intramembrane metalloprotease [Clostridiales bacterium]|nr:CPBP family intramembrane metalloprotease [Clostridiales bacterium]
MTDRKKIKISKAAAIFLIVMTVLSFANLIRIEIEGSLLKLAGLTVIIGVVAFFVTRGTNDSKYEGLNIKTALSQMKSKKVIILALIPIVIDVTQIFIEKAFFPEILEHTVARIPFEIDPAKVVPIILQLLLVPLGEEIALRAFYQKQMNKLTGSVPALVIASFIFAMGHFSYGNPAIVAVDLAGVFIDSIFYGLVFKETDNAWCSWISHSLADIVAVIVMMLFL